MNTWPDPDVPQSVKAALLKHLTEPFQSLAEAKSHWQQNDIQLVISKLPDDATAEYTDPLPDGYSISLVITSDSGEGIYYLTPPNQE